MSFHHLLHPAASEEHCSTSTVWICLRFSCGLKNAPWQRVLSGEAAVSLSSGGIRRSMCLIYRLADVRGYPPRSSTATNKQRQIAFPFFSSWVVLIETSFRLMFFKVSPRKRHLGIRRDVPSLECAKGVSQWHGNAVWWSETSGCGPFQEKSVAPFGSDAVGRRLTAPQGRH